jgi:hypothetical protein
MRSICRTSSRYESCDGCDVLDARRRFHAAGDVDAERTHGGDSRDHVFRSESARENQGGPDIETIVACQQVPGSRFAGPAVASFHARIYQAGPGKRLQTAALIEIICDALQSLGADAEGANDAIRCQSRQEGCGFIAVQLDCATISSTE